MLDILAISPHPDDVELCCGGLIAKMSDKGYHVGIVDLTKGELGSEGSADIRLREAAEAADILGVQIRDNMDFGDCRVGSSFGEAKKLAGILRQCRPSLVIAPYGDDHHPDHTASRQLADKAVFFSKLANLPISHAAHQIGRVVYYMLHKSFDPTFIVDVTQSYEKKVKAIKAYRSQMRLMSGIEGLLKSIELRDQTYGQKIGVKCGEPFFCATPLEIDDLVVLPK